MRFAIPYEVVLASACTSTRMGREPSIEHKTVPGANHFFVNEMDLLMKAVDDYLDFRLDPACPIR